MISRPKSLFIENISGTAIPKDDGSEPGEIIHTNDEQTYYLKLSTGHDINMQRYHSAIFEAIYLRIYKAFYVAPSAFLTLKDKVSASAMLSAKLPNAFLPRRRGLFLDPDYAPRLESARFGDRYLCLCTESVEGAIKASAIAEFAKKHQSLPDTFEYNGQAYPIVGLGAIAAIASVAFGDIDWLSHVGDNIVLKPIYKRDKQTIEFFEAYAIDPGMSMTAQSHPNLYFRYGATATSRIDFHKLPKFLQNEFMATINAFEDINHKQIIADVFEEVKQMEATFIPPPKSAFMSALTETLFGSNLNPKRFSISRSIRYQDNTKIVEEISGYISERLRQWKQAQELDTCHVTAEYKPNKP